MHSSARTAKDRILRGAMILRAYSVTAYLTFSGSLIALKTGRLFSGTGTIATDSAVLYRIPLPDGLDGVRALRALTTTLAWFSPVNPRHQGYRMAALDVSAASEDKYWMADDRDPYQPTDKAVVRGTVFHERRTGEAAKVFVDEGYILLRVSCRAAAGTLADPIPYALAVSFEVAIATGIPVYEQVRARLESRFAPELLRERKCAYKFCMPAAQSFPTLSASYARIMKKQTWRWKRADS